MEATSLLVGSGFASGINLYAVVALLGIFGRVGDADIPDVLSNPIVIGVAVAFFAVEFVADKVPYVDNVWDAIHTIVRPIGAAVLAVMLTTDADTLGEVANAATSGGLALVAHTAKATARAAINTSPEPASNITVSLAEDGLVAAIVWFAIENPILALVIVTLLVILSIILTVTAWRVARRGLARARERLSSWRSRGQPG